MFDIPEGEQSAYNSAIQYMYELATIRRQLHEARWSYNIDLRYDVLVSYFQALWPRMTDKLRIFHRKCYNEISQTMSGYYSAKSKQRPFKSNILSMLNEWELQLREAENDLGLLVPNKSDPAFALGGKNY